MRIFLKVLKILGALLLLLLFPLILLLDWLLSKIPIPDEPKSGDAGASKETASKAAKPKSYTPPVPDCFRALGMTTASCTAEEIKHQYRLMAMRAHPDVGGSEAAMKEINRAYEQAMTYCA